MKKILLSIILTAFSVIGNAQEWTFEINPMYFSCEGSNLYNDTADRLKVKVVGNTGNDMLLFCELSNSSSSRAVRPGRNYTVPIQVLSLLVANGKDIEEINQVLSAFDVVAIREIN